MLSAAAILLAAQSVPPPPPGYVLDRAPWERYAVAVPPGWSMIAQGDTGSIWAIHDKTMTRDRGVVSLWVRIDHSRDKTEPARTTRGRLSVVCESRKFWWRSLTAFAASGRELPQRWSRSSLSEDIAPDTMEELIWRRVC